MTGVAAPDRYLTASSAVTLPISPAIGSRARVHRAVAEHLLREAQQRAVPGVCGKRMSLLALEAGGLAGHMEERVHGQPVVGAADPRHALGHGGALSQS